MANRMRLMTPTHALFRSLPLLLALCLLAGCEAQQEQAVQMDIPFRADGYLDFQRPDGTRITRIAIEIAESDSAQARGLMNRRSLPSRGGMLFVNEDMDMRSFWMKNTPLALDIIFVDDSLHIVNIAKRTMPFTETRVNSTDSAQYVVEVRAGFTDQHNITDADRIVWRRTPPQATEGS